MASVGVERVPVQVLGLGRLGFDHLHIVFQGGQRPDSPPQDDWFVIEGLRESVDGAAVLGVEGWDGGTTLSEANGGLTGEDLARRIGLSSTRGTRTIADGAGAIETWATLVSYATDIAAQMFPYIAAALPGSPLPTINSSSLVASLLHHSGLDVDTALPRGIRLSPGIGTLLGTSRDDTLAIGGGFTTLVGGAGDDILIGGNAAGEIDKLYGGSGNDVIRWSAGFNIIHGGQPGLPCADDGLDTVDYSGAGELRLEAPPQGLPHRTPDFIVTHSGGQDHLFSVEEIIWDSKRDRLVIGEGVEVVPTTGPSSTGAALSPANPPATGLSMRPTGGEAARGSDVHHGDARPSLLDKRLDLRALDPVDTTDSEASRGEFGDAPRPSSALEIDPDLGIRDLACDPFDVALLAAEHPSGAAAFAAFGDVVMWG